MPLAEKRRGTVITVEFREIESGWVIATSEDRPGLFAADRSREDLDLTLRRALVETVSAPGEERFWRATPIERDWLTRQFARYELVHI